MVRTIIPEYMSYWPSPMWRNIDDDDDEPEAAAAAAPAAAAPAADDDDDDAPEADVSRRKVWSITRTWVGYGFVVVLVDPRTWRWLHLEVPAIQWTWP